MAKNRVRKDGYHLSVVATDPATPASGDPVRFGLLTGVALTAEATGSNTWTGNPTGNTSVDFGPSVWSLSVKAVNDSGNSAVAAGDAIFYVDADTPKLSKKASGYFFGFALAAVTSGSTATIDVVHAPSPGSATLAASAVNSTQLAANAVTAAKLSSTLATGFIPIPLTSFREVAANATINAAGNGGLLASDTTPIFERVNGATDKQQRINWAASNSDELVASFPYPPDLDDTAAVTVNLLMKMAGATDTPTVAVSYFEGVGDTNAGGNTAALGTTIAAAKSVTIAASDIGAYPAMASIGIVPGAHTTDAAWLYACWIEYTRK